MSLHHGPIAAKGVAFVNLEGRVFLAAVVPRPDHGPGQRLDHRGWQDLAQLGQMGTSLDPGQAFFDTMPETLEQIHSGKLTVGITVLIA